MRRLLVSLSALGLLVGLSGCTHTAGCCDCDVPGHSCCGGGGPGPIGPGAPMPAGPIAAPLKAEPIKEMPKEDKKEEKAPEVMGDGLPN